MPPVFPSEITASALPCFTNSTAREMDESRFFRKAVAGLSSMVSTSLACTISARESVRPQDRMDV